MQSLPRATQSRPLVLTVLGRDRTGLVESLAALVAEHGGNWLESRMCRLGGEFAGILRVEVPAERQAALTAALQRLEQQGLAMVVRPDETPDRTPPQTRTQLQLELIGHDRPGIVRQITAALASEGVNVEELSTECVSAPMSGETLFKAEARLLVPASCDPAALQKVLEKIAADLMVDLRLAPVA
jgi:glycine cleavage system regulatory protein